jgi:hypothetical protein
MVEFHPFKLDAQKLVPVLQRDLYRDPCVMLRELTQNAVDSLTRRAKFQPTFNPVKDGYVRFTYDKENKVITVSDNGCGMSRKLLLDVFRFYGRSDKDGDELGCRGLGAKSIFTCADSFMIQTRSIETDENLSVYVTVEGLSFMDSPESKEDYGTTITIPSDKPFSESALREFCRCVEVPVHAVVDGVDVIVSQKAPFDVVAAAIQGDGFDIYLDGKEGEWSWSSYLYAGGLYVCRTEIIEGVDSIALNVKHKDLVDLTISRDHPIENEKWQALKENVQRTLERYLKSISFDKRFLASPNCLPLFAWLNANKKAMDMLNDEARKQFQELSKKVRAVQFDASCLSTVLRRGAFLKVVLEDKSRRVYYSRQSLTNISETLRSNPMHRNDRVIYWTDMKRELFAKWAEVLGIEEFEVERRIPRKRVVWTPGGQEQVGEVSDVAKWEGYANLSIVVAPQGTNAKILRQIAEFLDCIVVKLRPSESIPAAIRSRVVDLRNAAITPKIWLFGRETEVCNITHLVESNIRVVPPHFDRYLDVINRREVVVPCDLASAAFLMLKGVEEAHDDQLRQLISAKIPPTCNKTMLELIYDERDLLKLSKIVANIDWNNPYSTAVFHFCVLELRNGSNLHWFSPCETLFGSGGDGE